MTRLTADICMVFCSKWGLLTNGFPGCGINCFSCLGEWRGNWTYFYQNMLFYYILNLIEHILEYSIRGIVKNTLCKKKVVSKKKYN